MGDEARAYLNIARDDDDAAALIHDHLGGQVEFGNPDIGGEHGGNKTGLVGSLGLRDDHPDGPVVDDGGNRCARPHTGVETVGEAKIASDLTGKGARVLIAAGDTFRAAAVEQLKVWAERAGADFMSKPQGSDAAALAFEAVERGKAGGYDVVLIDTAGRLQNKSALMNELLKVIRVIKKVDADAPHETLLVLDATVGGNAVAQENIFGNAIGVSGIVMTKLDGTARGGVLVPVARASDSPIKLIGVGEGVDDLQDFDARAFSRSLVGLGEKEL